MRLRLPTNQYEDDVTDTQVALAVYEELRSIRWTLFVVALFAVPLMLLGIVRLLFG